MSWQTLMWVGLGGMLGACSRYGVTQFVISRSDASFPFGTLLVNASGSLVIGVVVVVLLATEAAPAWRLFLVTGVLGGYTTFSAFSLETLTLIEDGQWRAAALYVVASTAIGLAACWGGATLARALIR